MFKKMVGSLSTIIILELVKCGVLQKSILAPLLFLLHVNGLKYISSFLDSIMFADDKNLF